MVKETSIIFPVEPREVMSEFDSKSFDTLFKKANEVKAQLRLRRQRLQTKRQNYKAAKEVVEIFEPGCSALCKQCVANKLVR